MRRLAVGVALVVALAAAGCGSTVQTEIAGQPGAGQVAPGDSLNGAVTPGSPGGVVSPDGAVVGDPSNGNSIDNNGTSLTGGTGDPSITSPSTDPDGGAPPATAPTEGVEVGANDPIEIGFVSTTVSNAEALGLPTGSSYSDKSMYAALVKEYNAAGGLAGHPIVPVIAETDTGSSNWSGEFAAACSTFTEDNEVKAVIGYQFAFYDAFEACLAKADVAHFYGGYQPGDAANQQQYPTLIATGHPTVDGSTLTALDGGLKTGLIGGDKKLGLMVDTCANGRRAFETSTERWLKANRISYQAVLIDCAGGATDVSSAAAAVSSAELQFASGGVDTVFAVGIGLLVFMQQAESQLYRPNYITTIAANAVATLAPREQGKKLHGFGWMPIIDVALNRQPYAQTAPQKACLAKLARQGLVPREINDFMTAYQTCDGLELYAKALAMTQSVDSVAVAGSMSQVVKQFKGTGTYSGVLRVGTRQRGGPAVYRESIYDSRCSCMNYRGPTYPVPLP